MSTAVVWFRQDLRLADNPALTAAVESAERLIPLYIYEAQEEWSPGAASRWWLHHSLLSLEHSLRQRGSRLVIMRGPATEVLPRLCRQSGASHVYWNRQYEPTQLDRDKRLKQQLRDEGLNVRSFNGALLFEPWQVLKGDGAPYKVFTPYWNALQRLGLPAPLTAAPGPLPPCPAATGAVPPDELGLLPKLGWADGFHHHWQPGEDGAHVLLDNFIETALAGYSQTRDIPAEAGTSRLSPHLHFGEISPRQLIHTIQQATRQTQAPGMVGNAESYLRQLAWREFAYYLLYHFPHTTNEPFNPRFQLFPWGEDDAVVLAAWQRGRTGIPIVDAGMRELWHTGWMHNRVRMLVASFLTKNLLQHWLHGARWFQDTLVDADLAANTLGWQWTAGCGADAAPYFRLFNPVLQGRKFDPRGRYVRRWVPELSALPDKFLHRPWEAPPAVLQAAGVVPGKTYPLPLVDLKRSRAEALRRYHALKTHRRD